LIAKHEVVARIQEEVDRFNSTLGKVQKIKQFRLVPEEWTPTNGELSPTLKLKRKFVKMKYANLIDDIYADNKGI
jgi:long-chain acyl-CoA synthetase